MLEKLENGVVLYHGSFCEVSAPDLQKCSRYKDFGQGFYLTTDHEQALSFAKITTQRAIESGAISADRNYGIVSTFVYTERETCCTKFFENADFEWLHCIVAHRRKGALGLKNQYCFRTANALKNLTFKGSEKSWM